MGYYPVEMAGKRFGRLLVLSRHGLDGQHNITWMCLCDCGNYKVIQGMSMRDGRVRSCGCLKSEIQTKHGLHKTREYVIWSAMKQRCCNPKNDHYKYYGGRGISVCPKWKKSFQNFLNDMGFAPTPLHTIDRIDNDGNYCPSNCRWATMKEQATHRRPSRPLTFNGKTQSMTEWANEIGVHISTMSERVGLWSIERALTTPPLTNEVRHKLAVERKLCHQS